MVPRCFFLFSRRACVRLILASWCVCEFAACRRSAPGFSRLMLVLEGVEADLDRQWQKSKRRLDVDTTQYIVLVVAAAAAVGRVFAHWLSCNVMFRGWALRCALHLLLHRIRTTKKLSECYRCCCCDCCGRAHASNIVSFLFVLVVLVVVLLLCLCLLLSSNGSVRCTRDQFEDAQCWLLIHKVRLRLWRKPGRGLVVTGMCSCGRSNP